MKPFDSAPLSFGQERLWFLDRLGQGSPAYNEVTALRLMGRLDPKALECCFNEIVRRHEALRTTFIEKEGQPAQLVRPFEWAALPVVDLSGDAEVGEADRVRSLIAQEQQLPFDLAKVPPWRIKLFRLGESLHILLFTKHHIIFDGWSRAVFLRELGMLYAAIMKGDPPSLPELSIQYRDFARWQRQALQGDKLERLLSHWKQRLGEHPPALELATDRPPPAERTFAGARESTFLSKPLADDLKALCRKHRVTLYMMLLAAYQTLLQRYTGQDDIVVGSPIAGRTRVETEGLIGFFVNTLVLRADLSGNPTFVELLARVRNVALEAYEHQDLPFEKLVAELRPPRAGVHAPLFRVIFQLVKAPQRPVDFGVDNLRIEEIDRETAYAKFDLALDVVEKADGLRCRLDYSTDLFERCTMNRMLGHFRTLLEGIARDPERRLADLPLLTAPERRQVLEEWNDTASDFPQNRCVHELFAAQAERTPDAVAVTSADTLLTYRELNREANRLAHYLTSRGVRHEGVVGVCLDQSPALIVAMLGVLKAGAAYLPLDPALPSQRLADILSDAGAVALVAERAVRDKLPVFTGLFVDLERESEALCQAGDADPMHEATAESFAYVMYTSGSTGRPKGVAVPHRAIARLVLNTDYLQITASDVVAQAADPSFDATTFEVWGALLNGARLVLLPKDVVLSPPDFAAALDKHRVSVLFLTTSLFNIVVREVPTAFRKLCCLLFGGEVADPHCVRALLSNGRPERLLHMYGPTEATTFATWYQVEAVPDGASSIPIGRPIAATEVYVLDRHLNPVPAGIPGELYIGGPGVARGYLNRPDLTAERFIPNPFRPGPYEHLYKTGDQVRHQSDGNLAFLGRLDSQVKIRGFRVELGEVEAQICLHAAVRQAVVIFQKGQAGEGELVAYVERHPGAVLAATDLRAFLKEKLPGYMLPAAMVFLDRLPLTAGGKVDRSALAKLDYSPAREVSNPVLPRDALEARLTEIWEALLGVRPIGVRDDFFELGGHSLLAVRLFAEIERVFGQRLPLATLFQHGSIERLAAVLRKEGSHERHSLLVPIQPGGSRPPFFCIHPAGGTTLVYRDLAHALGPDQPVVGVEQVASYRKQRRYDRVEDLAARHAREIRAFQRQGPYFLGGYSGGGVIAFELARQLVMQGQQVGLLVLLDSGCPGFAPPLPLIQRIPIHLRNAIRLESGEKRTYILDGARRVKKNLEVRGYRILDRLWPLKEQPLSRAILNLEVANRRAIASYSPKSYGGRVAFFWATQSYGRFHQDDSRVAWRQFVTGEMEIHELPGHHGTIISQPVVTVLAERLRACLLRAQQVCYES